MCETFTDPEQSFFERINCDGNPLSASKIRAFGFTGGPDANYKKVSIASVAFLFDPC